MSGLTKSRKSSKPPRRIDSTVSTSLGVSRAPPFAKAERVRPRAVSRVAIYGLLALACFALHAGRHLVRRKAHEIFWICTLAAAVVGIGCLAGSRMLVAVGVSWLAYGTPLWLLAVLAGEEFLVTS